MFWAVLIWTAKHTGSLAASLFAREEHDEEPELLEADEPAYEDEPLTSDLYVTAEIARPIVDTTNVVEMKPRPKVPVPKADGTYKLPPPTIFRRSGSSGRGGQRGAE